MDNNWVAIQLHNAGRGEQCGRRRRRGMRFIGEEVVAVDEQPADTLKPILVVAVEN